MKKLGALFVLVGASLPLLGLSAVAAPPTGRYLVQFEAGTDPDLEATALPASKSSRCIAMCSPESPFRPRPA